MSEAPAAAGDLLRILALWRRQAVWLGLGAVVSLVSAGSMIALMGQSGHKVAYALIGGVLAAPVVLRLLGAGRVVLRYAERVLTHEATFRALADLRVWFFRGLAERSAGGLGFGRVGDVLSRLVNDVEALDGLYLRITVPGLIACVLLVALPVLLWSDGAAFALAETALFAGAAVVRPVLAARDALRQTGDLAAATGELRVATLDLVGGLREARAFGAEERLRAAILERQARQQVAMEALGKAGTRAQLGAFALGQAAMVVALLLVALRGRGEPVAAVTAVFVIVASFEAVGLLPRAGALAGHAAASARRVLEAAAGPIAVAVPAVPAAMPAGSSLRFENVGFAWAADRGAVFENLSLDIPRGARVAVLGPSGSGKSTLAALALRVVLPQTGRVLLGNVDIAALRPEDVRARFSWLSQASHLFNDTIRANLVLARPEADEAALWAALDAARIGEFVRALPDGLDAWVGEGGARFSGGQGRRLALARALLSPAPILILDEPCAGLDAQTEQEFFSTLNEAIVGRGMLLIAHRLSGVERLDRIYRLSDGHAVAAAG